MSEGRNLSSAPFAYMENELKKMGHFGSPDKPGGLSI